MKSLRASIMSSQRTLRLVETGGILSQLPTLRVFFVFLLVSSGHLLAATYYADPTNPALCSQNPTPCCCAAPSGAPDPNCGTSSAPYTCLSDAIARATTGDTVEARTGTYYECADISSKQNILVTAQTFGAAVIEFTETHPVCANRISTWGDRDAVWIRNSTNTTFRGFVVRGATHEGIQLWSGTNTGNRIENTDIRVNGQGVLFYSSGNYLIASTVGSNSGDGVTVGPAVTDTRIWGVAVEDNGGAGVALYPGANFTDISSSSTIRDNGGTGLVLQANDSLIWNTTVTGNGGYGIQVSGSNNDIVGGEVGDVPFSVESRR